MRFWKTKTRSEDERGKPFPFKMHTITNMEHYRANSFWTKEPETIAWIDGFKADSIMVDVGANIGVYSLYCAMTKPRVHVYAFEPLQENFTRLVDNILLNKCHNITPINMGVGKNAQISNFYVKNSGVGESGSQINSPHDEFGKEIKPECVRNVIVTSFDTFWDMVPAKRPCYLKIDVDGRELDVLRGISRHFPCLEGVLIEINTAQTSISDVTMLMKTWGLVPDARINKMKPHSTGRRGGNPVNVVYTRPY
jgi:FkbM family methyltransferase